MSGPQYYFFRRHENSPLIPPRSWSIRVEILHMYGIYSLPFSCRPCTIDVGQDSYRELDQQVSSLIDVDVDWDCVLLLCVVCV